MQAKIILNRQEPQNQAQYSRDIVGEILGISP